MTLKVISVPFALNASLNPRGIYTVFILRAERGECTTRAMADFARWREEEMTKLTKRRV